MIAIGPSFTPVTTVTNRSSKQQPDCKPAFHLQSGFSKENCLVANYVPQRGAYIFQWIPRINIDEPDRWVMLRSGEKPGVIQICYDDGRKKCLVATNQETRESAKTVLMGNYQSTSKADPAQLWRFNKESGEIVNEESFECLVTLLARNMPGATLVIGTKPCEDMCRNSDACEFTHKKWRFTRIVNEDNIKICADFPIPSKNNRIGNFGKNL